MNTINDFSNALTQPEIPGSRRMLAYMKNGRVKIKDTGKKEQTEKRTRKLMDRLSRGAVLGDIDEKSKTFSVAYSNRIALVDNGGQAGAQLAENDAITQEIESFLESKGYTIETLDTPETQNMRASLREFLSNKNRDALIREYFALQETTHRVVDPKGMHARHELKPLWHEHHIDVVPSLMRNHKEAMKEIAKSTGISIRQIEAAIALKIILSAIENSRVSEKRQEEKREKAKDKERTETDRADQRVERRTEDSKNLERKLDGVRVGIQKILRRLAAVEIVKDKIHIRFRESDEGEPSLEDLVFSVTPMVASRPNPTA